MLHIEELNQSLSSYGTKSTLSLDSLDNALALRSLNGFDEEVTSALLPLGVERLSDEDQLLFRTRIIGTMAVKYAISSALNPNLSEFTDLTELQQSAAIYDIAAEYAIVSEERLSDTLEDPQVLLQPLQVADPLNHVTNSAVRTAAYRSRRSSTSFIGRTRMIASYVNVLPNSFPPSPYIVPALKTHDSILVQAFGRDSVTDAELIGIKELHDSLGDDATFEYLASAEVAFKPGPSNDALADVLFQKLQESQPSEQIVQWEVAFSLWQRYPETFKKYRNYIHILWPHTGFYPTYEVKSDSIEKMDQYGLFSAEEFAHQDMMVRALAILNKFGVIADPLIADIPYDPLSTQPHVQNERKWIVREAAARAEHALRGRIRF